MTEREKKSMTWAAALLLGAAAFRFLLIAPAPAEPPLGDRPSIADSLLVAGDEAVEEKERRSRPFEPGETLDPNVAGDEELDRLPGVGPARALQIVQDREERGPFRTVDELARVPGIGPASVERLRPFVQVHPATLRSAGVSTGGGERSPAVAATPGAPGGGGLVNINRATAAELQTIPGIGPVIAERIVAHRGEHGPFRQVDELMLVAGVGERTLARIAPLVTVRR